MNTFETLAAQASVYTPEYQNDFQKVAKEDLVGVPFIVTDYRMQESRDGSHQYAVVEIVREDGETVVFTDGGAAIIPALQSATLPLLVNGLELSKNGQTWRFAG